MVSFKSIVKSALALLVMFFVCAYIFWNWYWFRDVGNWAWYWRAMFASLVFTTVATTNIVEQTKVGKKKLDEARRLHTAAKNDLMATRMVAATLKGLANQIKTKGWKMEVWKDGKDFTVFDVKKDD